MFSVITITEEDEREGELKGPRFGLSVRDLQNMCTAKGIKFAVVTRTSEKPISPELLNQYLELGVDTIIVDQA